MVDLSAPAELNLVSQRVLVIAHSGRMLAHLVSQAGYVPLVIDVFADQDTVEIAEQVWQVENLSLSVMQQVVQCLLLKYTIHYAVYGSGLENQPDTLRYLAEHFTVIGNNAVLCQKLCRKKSFFKQLDRLAIRYPDVSFSLPDKPANWLIKPCCHGGGLGISWCDRVANNKEYYQLFCKGITGSALFCADGQYVTIIGFQRQWSVSQTDFTFAGIIQECFLPDVEQNRVQDWLKKLVQCYHLRGLGGLDFIWDGKVCYFLEINPRPPASMLLYPELDLLGAHVNGKLTVSNKTNIIRALQIIYAKQPCRIKAASDWPRWSLDRPPSGKRIQRAEPVCTIMAQDVRHEKVLDSLIEKQAIIENIIY